MNKGDDPRKYQNNMGITIKVSVGNGKMPYFFYVYVENDMMQVAGLWEWNISVCYSSIVHSTANGHCSSW
jgi:hypothetical protein